MSKIPEDSSWGPLREEMVATQIIARGIFDERVLSAMRNVPRHLFVPAPQRAASYDDCALPIGEGQTISQPFIVAAMTQLLELKGGEKVLEVGTGSGYQAAILALLAKQVYTVERVKTLADSARTLLRSLGHDNVDVIEGDGSLGLPAFGPFDGIIITAACPDIPKPLLEGLAEGGRLVLPMGERYHQVLTVATKKDGRISLYSGIACVFVPLLGEYGFKE